MLQTPGRISSEHEGQWPMSPFEFKAFKHNRLVAALVLQAYKLRSRGLEKLVFTATTGRTGTMTLAKLFAAIPDCAAVHEGHPVMNGPVLRAASYGDRSLVDRVYHRIKSVNIRRAAVTHRYYLEANHLFIKTFIENAIEDFGERMAVVHLVRPAVEVANSIYSLHNYPGTESGNYWWLDHRAPTNFIPLAHVLDSDAAFSHPFYKALWYWHEVEARISAWRAKVPEVKFIRFETRWLNDLQKVVGLLDEIGIRYEMRALEAKIGIKEHTKRHEKVSAALPAEQACEMACRFEELLQEMNLPRR